MSRFLRVYLTEADPAVMAAQLRQVADKIEGGAQQGNAAEPAGSRNLTGAFQFVEFDDRGKEVLA